MLLIGESYFRLQPPNDARRECKAALAQDPTYAPAAEALKNLDQAKR